MKTIIFLFILIPNLAYCQYFENFSNEDIILQSIYTGVSLIDWIQTKKLRETEHKELNPILGSDPDQETIDSLILSGIIVHGLIGYILPKKYRSYWQMFFIGVETHTIVDNHNHGVRISFGF